MDAKFVASTTEVHELGDFQVAGDSHATSAEVSRIIQQCEANSEIDEQDLYRRIWKHETQASRGGYPQW